MSTPLLSRRDLDFLLFEWLDIGSLTRRPRFEQHSEETFRDFLRASERLAVEQFAPHNKRGDQIEPRMVDGQVELIPEVKTALAAFAEMGLIGACLDADVGGLALPRTLASACFAWFQAANIGTASYPFLTIAAANLLLAHGSTAQAQTYVAPMVEGRYFGTMCLSETQAGSSLGDIRTHAQKQEDGSYRIVGNKMWISAGDHELSENIVHLLLARTQGIDAGTRGLSLFIVPKYLVGSGERNDIALVGLNHKMGSRGTTNTVLHFGEGAHRPGGAAGAIGELIGEEGQGLAYMFHMMNEARIGVGLAAASLGCSGYLHSREYAAIRAQGRRPGAGRAEGPALIIGHADVRRMLMLQRAWAEGSFALGLYCSRLVDEQLTGVTDAARVRAGRLLDILTPIAKSWPSQWCLEANSLAIQVHGGYGYTREYNVEQLYRDNRLNAIHEGTNGIQGLDLLGRKVVMDEGACLRALLEAVRETTAKAAGSDEFADLGRTLAQALERVDHVTATLWSAADREVTLANSSVYLDAVGHVVIAWMWLEMALTTLGHDGDFYEGKRRTARFFFGHVLPGTAAQFDLLESLDTATLEMSDRWL